MWGWLRRAVTHLRLSSVVASVESPLAQLAMHVCWPLDAHSVLCRCCISLAPDARMPPVRLAPLRCLQPQSFCQYRGKVQSMSPEEIENLKKCDKVRGPARWVLRGERAGVAVAAGLAGWQGGRRRLEGRPHVCWARPPRTWTPAMMRQGYGNFGVPVRLALARVRVFQDKLAFPAAQLWRVHMFVGLD